MALESTTTANQYENQQFDTEDYEYELDLNDPEGARFFLESAEDLFVDAMQWDAVARTEDYARLRLQDVPGEEVFQAMSEIMAELQTKIRPDEATDFTESETMQLQSLYDELEIITEYITTKYGPVQTASKISRSEDSRLNNSKDIPETEKGFSGRKQRRDMKIDANEEREIQKLSITITQDKPATVAVVSDIKENQPYRGARETDPIAKVAPFPSPGIMKPAEELKERSLTGQYLLSDEEYRNFIEQRYSSPVAFERFIDMKITKFEAQTVDAFERWLGEEFQSPFVFLQDKSVAEVVALSQSPEVRQIMNEQQIKYETFVAWVDRIDEMQSVVQLDTSRTFGELVARWFIESELATYSSRT